MKGYVVYKNIVYGLGEEVLFPFFKKSILESDKGLNVVGNGENVLPTIHVLDLCQIIEEVVFKNPDQRSYIASDGSNLTQNDIIKAISTNLG